MDFLHPSSLPLLLTIIRAGFKIWDHKLPKKVNSSAYDLEVSALQALSSALGFRVLLRDSD